MYIMSNDINRSTITSSESEKTETLTVPLLTRLIVNAPSYANVISPRVSSASRTPSFVLFKFARYVNAARHSNTKSSSAVAASKSIDQRRIYSFEYVFIVFISVCERPHLPECPAFRKKRCLVGSICRGSDVWHFLRGMRMTSIHGAELLHEDLWTMNEISVNIKIISCTAFDASRVKSYVWGLSLA